MKHSWFWIGFGIISIGIFIMGCSPADPETFAHAEKGPQTMGDARELAIDGDQGGAGGKDDPGDHVQGLPAGAGLQKNAHLQKKTGDVSLSAREEKRMFASRHRVIAHVDSANFAGKVLNASRPVLVDFYADWCPPCRALAPVLQEVASEVDHVDVVKVNVDDDPALAKQFRVSAIPTLILIKDGQPVERITGFVPKQQLKELLAKYE